MYFFLKHVKLVDCICLYIAGNVLDILANIEEETKCIDTEILWC